MMSCTGVRVRYNEKILFHLTYLGFNSPLLPNRLLLPAAVILFKIENKLNCLKASFLIFSNLFLAED